MIQFQTLGAIDLRRDGTEVRSVLSQPKRLALLAYLAVASPRGFQSRDRLLGLFWPESDEERARNALRQSLHYLRRSLGEAAVEGRGDREVGLGPDVACDAAAFEDGLAAGRPSEALELYRGEFLAGLYLEDAPDVERWIEEQRSRFRRLAVAAARAAAEAEEKRGDARLAASYMRRALTIEPLDEASLRNLVELLDAAGERSEAVRALEEFARRFEDELGLGVSAETRTLAARVRAGLSPERVVSQATTSGEPAVREPAREPSAPVVADATTFRKREPPPGRSVANPLSARRRRLRLRPRAALTAAAVLVVAGVAIGLMIARTRGMVAAAAAAGPPAIAVLPFANMSGDPSHELYSDGLAEELMTALARVPGLRVVARTSAFSFKGQAVAVDSIARALRVVHVLEGSVRIDGDRLRVTAKLVDAVSGYQVWAETYDENLSDAFAVQDAIARSIVAALEPSLGVRREAVVAPETADPRAHEEVLRGLAALRLDSPEGYDRAGRAFERALARDSGYARAWAGLARVRVIDAYRRIVPPERGYAEARAMAERSIAIDPGIAAAHVTLGRVAGDGDWDFAAAERHFRRALQISPADEHATMNLARLLAHLGRHEEAVHLDERLVELDPIAPIAHRWLGSQRLMSGDHEGAIAALRTALALAPQNEIANVAMAYALSALGRHDEAVEAAEDALARGPAEQLFVSAAAWAHGRAGNTERARELLSRIEAAPQPANYYRAMVHVALGEHDRAFELLDHAIAQRESLLPQIAVWPAFEPLRADPRFAAVLRQVGLRR